MGLLGLALRGFRDHAAGWGRKGPQVAAASPKYKPSVLGGAVAPFLGAGKLGILSFGLGSQRCA